MKRIAAALCGASLMVSSLMVSGCGAPAAETTTPAPAAAAVATPAIPEAVDGWREYPVREGVISIQPGKWRTDVIDISIAPGKGLEYKLTMKKGEGVVYNVSYTGLEHPGMMVVEFHGHTEQVDGVGDLMYYSKTGGSPESGVFTAPWDGIHGWYFKNESPAEVTVRLDVAGFYALEAPKP